MAITLFELLAKLSLDASEFNTGVAAATASGQKLKGELEGTTQSASKLALDIADSIGRSIGTIFGNLIVSIPQFLSSTVDAARELEAEMAQYTAVFVDSVTDADATFARLSEYSGVYYTRLRSAGTDFYAQFKAGGMESEEAMAMMESSMMLAADAAAFYDISLEDASQRLRSFLRGNVEAGESIGLFANDMSRTNKSMELFGAKWTALTEAQRELVLLSIAQDAYASSGATGQASREADAYANKLENIKAIWQNIKATIGGPILDAITPVIEKFEEFLKSNPEFVDELADSLGEIADVVSGWILSFLDWLINNSDEVLGFLKSIGQFLGIVPGHNVIDARSDEAATLADDVTTNRQLELEKSFADLIKAASTSGTEDDEAARDTWWKLMQQGYMDSTLAYTGEELYDAIMEHGFGIFGEGTTPESIIDYINAAETSEGMEQKLDELLNSVFDDQGNLIVAINSLPDALTSALTAVLPGALSGMQVVLNDNIVGVVAAGMARNARDARYVGSTKG